MTLYYMVDMYYPPCVKLTTSLTPSRCGAFFVLTHIRMCGKKGH